MFLRPLGLRIKPALEGLAFARSGIWIENHQIVAHVRSLPQRLSVRNGWKADIAAHSRGARTDHLGEAESVRLRVQALTQIWQRHLLGSSQLWRHL
jgi:hypothetical protein